MTSPVAPVGLTYAAQDLQASDLSVFFEIIAGLGEPPSVRGVDVIVPALDGRVEGNRKNDILHIELEGYVGAAASATNTQDRRESFQANRAAVRVLFATNRARAALVATLEDGATQLTIDARPMNMIWTTIVGSELAKVNIELEGYGDWAEVV